MPKAMILTDKAPRRHGLPGAEVMIDNNCVRFFKENGWAVPTEEAKARQARELEDKDLAALRAEYQRKTGESPDGRWKAETLRAKIDDASRLYHRRDMRAED